MVKKFVRPVSRPGRSRGRGGTRKQFEVCDVAWECFVRQAGRPVARVANSANSANSVNSVNSAKGVKGRPERQGVNSAKGVNSVNSVEGVKGAKGASRGVNDGQGDSRRKQFSRRAR